MFKVLIALGIAAFLARKFNASRQIQFSIPICGIGAVIGLHLILPIEHGFRLATGGSAANWTIVLVLVALGAFYAFGLQKLKAMTGTAQMQSKTDKMNDVELERYARHIVLREIGGAGQQRLRNSKVLVVGAGGLGCPSLMYLAAAGVGTIGVIDDDIVSLSNLQRQVLFREDDIDTPKVFAAKKHLLALNPHIAINTYNRRLDVENANDLIGEYDLVLDGTDSFTTRALVNKACVETQTPLISGAIGQWEGQVSVFDTTQNAPCYACLFPKEPADGLAPSCSEVGVVGALPGIIGSMMASEAIKFIAKAGQNLLSEMYIFDALYGESRKVKITKRADCAVCGDK